MKKMSRAIIVGLFIVLAGQSPLAAEEPKPVVVTGVATVQEGHLDIARDAALEDALRRAVEQAVGTMVESETLVQNFQLVSDNILAKTRGYVRNYQIISEQQDKELLKVTIQATVDAANLENDLTALGLLYQRVKKPRIMVIISEPRGGLVPQQGTDPAGETEIVKQLVQKGFKVVDPGQVRKIRESDQVRKAVEGDVKAAQLIGQRFGAEVMILGESVGQGATRNESLGGMISARANLSAKAIRMDTGDVLVAESAVAPGLDISEQIASRKAQTAAAGKWVEAAIPALIKQWSKEVSGENSVQLVVTGLSFMQLTKFKQVLTTQVRGVKDVQQRSFETNVAILDVDLKGSAQSLGEELSVKNFGTFKVGVTGYTPNRLDLKIIPISKRSNEGSNPSKRSGDGADVPPARQEGPH